MLYVFLILNWTLKTSQESKHLCASRDMKNTDVDERIKEAGFSKNVLDIGDETRFNFIEKSL